MESALYGESASFPPQNAQDFERIVISLAGKRLGGVFNLVYGSVGLHVIF